MQMSYDALPSKKNRRILLGINVWNQQIHMVLDRTIHIECADDS